MESNLLFVAIIGLIVWAIIIYYIIQSASKSKKIEQYQKKQMFLLAKMAQNSGVPKDEINKILSLKEWEHSI